MTPVAAKQALPMGPMQVTGMQHAGPVSFIIGERRFTLSMGAWCQFPDSALTQLALSQGITGFPIRELEDEDCDAFERVVHYLRRGGHRVVPPTDDEDLDGLEGLATKLGLRMLSAELKLERLRRMWEIDVHRIEREQEKLRLRLSEAARLATNGNYYEKGAVHPRTQQQNVQTVLVELPDSNSFDTSSSITAPSAETGCSLGPLVNRMTLHEGYTVVSVCPVSLPSRNEETVRRDSECVEKESEAELPATQDTEKFTPENPPFEESTIASTSSKIVVGVTLQKLSDVARIHGRGNELGRDTGALIARAVGVLDLRFHRFLLRQLPTRFRARSRVVDSRPPPPCGSFVHAEDFPIEFSPQSYYGNSGDGSLDYDPDFTSLGPEIDELFDHLLDRQVFEAGGLDYTDKDNRHQSELRARFERAFALPPSQGNISDQSDQHTRFFFDGETALRDTPHLRALESAVGQTRAYFKAQRSLLARLMTELPQDPPHYC